MSTLHAAYSHQLEMRESPRRVLVWRARRRQWPGRLASTLLQDVVVHTWLEVQSWKGPRVLATVNCQFSVHRHRSIARWLTFFIHCVAVNNGARPHVVETCLDNHFECRGDKMESVGVEDTKYKV